jgi:hypothetical protein
MILIRDFSARIARRLLGALVLVLPLAACLQVTGSNRGFDFPDATPSLPFRSVGFEHLSRSENDLINQMTIAIVQLVTIRVDDAGNHRIVIRNSAARGNAPQEIILPARYFALPESPSVLAIRFRATQFGQMDAIPAGDEEAYLYLFIEKTADIVQILPFNRAAIEAWRPATEADRQLRTQALALRSSGQGRDAVMLTEDVRQLELALRTASRLPTAQRATLRLRDSTSAPRPAPQANAARPAPPAVTVQTRWRFGRSQDPVTREVTQYANLATDPAEGGAPGGQLIQARCSGSRLELLFANGRLPLRNELSEGRLQAALMEINFDDRVVQRLIWQILERHPTTAIEPFGVGGLIGLAGMFEPSVQRASTTWNGAWLLNMLSGSDRVTLRVWDARHNAHVARFSPRAPIGEFRRHLSNCVP